MKIAIVSLGCPKNQADADVFCRALLEQGHTTVPDITLADLVIINTCGFIESAKEEAIQNILQACGCKQLNPNLKVVVTGCLAERYKQEIANEIPEVDAVVGIGCNEEIPQIVEKLGMQKEKSEILQRYGAKTDLPLGGKRIISTPAHYAWLKIAEGCSNACSYCAIPLIRGPLRSRPLEDCLEEARWLVQQDVKEIVLVAQDVTAYGEDKGENQIARLLDGLNAIEGLRWIRLLYAYPERITDTFLEAMARNKKVVQYLDMPIQHINDDILHSMRRKGDRKTIIDAVQRTRAKMPDITLRTSLIAGYPGESEEKFEELCEFVKEIKFDRLGCFAYSPEENTKAATLSGQIAPDERERRAQVIMQLQSNIMAEKQNAMQGRELAVVCDGMDEEGGWWLCRGEADAPEIDADVLVPAAAPLKIGGFYRVRVTQADVYDLYAEYIETDGGA